MPKLTSSAITLTCSTGAALPPMPTPPANAKNLKTTFGISPSSTADQVTALQNALNSLTAGDWLVCPPGPYRYSKRLMLSVPRVTLWSDQNNPAIFHSLTPSGGNSAIVLAANGVSVYGVTRNSVTTTRQAGTYDAGITIAVALGGPRVDGCTIRRCKVMQGPSTPMGSCAVGILMHHASNYLVAENYVSRTWADGIHQTQGSFNGRVIGNEVNEVGDDCIAVVSYLGDDTAANHDKNYAALRADRLTYNILVSGNNVHGNWGGRGITVVGGEDVTIENNDVGPSHYAALIMMAREYTNYYTFGVNNILIRNNRAKHNQDLPPTFIPPNVTHNKTGHGGFSMNQQMGSDELAYPNLTAKLAVQNIMWENNTLDDSAYSGTRVNPRGSSDSKLGKIGIRNNVMRRIAGKGIDVLAPLAPTAAYNVWTSGNTDDGVAVSYPGSSGSAPLVTGYKG